MVNNENINQVDEIYNQIENIIVESRRKVCIAVNTTLLENCWNIGFEVNKLNDYNKRADYGKEELKLISKKLSKKFGNGFSVANLVRMRKFYNLYPIIATVSQQLSWSHYVELIKINNEDERNFYCNESINVNWSIKELKRQKNSMLYNRLLLSTDKEKVKELSGYSQTRRCSKRSLCF